jgi:hypothetical protein
MTAARRVGDVSGTFTSGTSASTQLEPHHARLSSFDALDGLHHGTGGAGQLRSPYRRLRNRRR